MENKILIIDIETTGFSHTKDFITEVGMVELDVVTGDRLLLFDKVMYEPEMTLRKAFIRSKLAGLEFSLSLFDNAVNFEKEKVEIQEIINKYPNGATAFNNKFDFGFLEAREFVIPKKLDDPMLLLTPICKLSKKRGGGFKWPKVQEAWDFLFGEKTDYKETHHGGDDAMHEAQIVFEMIKRGEFKLDIVREPVVVKKQDSEGHWYWILEDLVSEFDLESEEITGIDYMDNPDAFDKFSGNFEKYRTLGDSDMVPEFFKK